MLSALQVMRYGFILCGLLGFCPAFGVMVLLRCLSFKLGAVLWVAVLGFVGLFASAVAWIKLGNKKALHFCKAFAVVRGCLEVSARLV